jgi:hypothetical protein
MQADDNYSDVTLDSLARHCERLAHVYVTHGRDRLALSYSNYAETLRIKAQLKRRDKLRARARTMSALLRSV